MEAVIALIRRIFKIIPALVGAIGVLIPLAREFAIGLVRVVAVILPRFDELIPKVRAFFDRIEKAWDNISRFLLGMPINPL